MAGRFTIRGNGCGGFKVVQRTKAGERKIGGDVSHRRNAEIKAARLNGERDADGVTDWAAFYGAR